MATATMSNAKNAAPSDSSPSRNDYEEFLIDEAALLDDWRLDDWLALFDETATYDVPIPGADDGADSAEQLFLVSDDYARLEHRVRRLNKPGAHSEYPRSRCVRSINNVKILGREGDVTKIRAVFITFRSKNDMTDTYFGHHIYEIRGQVGAFKIISKRTMLDMSSLRPQGRVSIIV